MVQTPSEQDEALSGHLGSETEDAEIKVGCELYKPATTYNRGRLYTVAKVGRKWLSLEGYERADKETLKIEGSHSQLYRSKAEWLRANEHTRIWRDFARQVDRTYGKPLASEEAIRKAAAILGITLTAITNA